MSLQGVFHVELTPEVCQKLLRCTPTLKVGIHMRHKDQKNYASRFESHYASMAKSNHSGYIHASTAVGELTPPKRTSGLSAWNAPWIYLNLIICN